MQASQRLAIINTQAFTNFEKGLESIKMDDDVRYMMNVVENHREHICTLSTLLLMKELKPL